MEIENIKYDTFICKSNYEMLGFDYVVNEDIKRESECKPDLKRRYSMETTQRLKFL